MVGSQAPALASPRRPRSVIWHISAAPWEWTRSENACRCGMIASTPMLSWRKMLGEGDRHRLDLGRGPRRLDARLLARTLRTTLLENTLRDYVTRSAGEDEVEYVAKIKRVDALKALELLGRHLGILEKDDRQQASVITIGREDAGA